jgi:murein DD-endopeptidase MepM/ murein hydrolase activator NlpD
MGVRRQKRLIFLAFLAGALLTAPGAVAQSLDGKINALRNQIASAKEKEGVLSSEIATAGDGIVALEDDIGELSSQVSSLESELESHRDRLARLEAKVAYQTRHVNRLDRDHRIAQTMLERRLVELYETDQMDTIEILLGVRSLGSLVDSFEYSNQIGAQDRAIAARLRTLEAEMRAARRETAAIRTDVAEQTAAIAVKTAAAQAARDSLVSRQNALEAARSEKASLLAGIKSKREDHEEDLEARLAASAALAAQIQAGSSSSGGSSGPPSAHGFIWPVSGPVTSGFGMRWGRMHEGIDIGVPTGTAIHAVAAGTVIYSGVMGGYGNIVVVDHGGGVSTAYAHMSAIWISGGTVPQGASLGAVGCTGHCFGPHLHFEVRVNGAPVDPLGYL